MFSWIKTKKSKSDDLAPEVARALRTMEDDLNGVPFPQKAEQLPPETSISYRSNPSQGVPFFAAQTGVQEKSTPAPVGNIPENPFLGAANTETPRSASPPPSAPLSFVAQQEEALRFDASGPPETEVSVRGLPEDEERPDRRWLWIGGTVLLVTLLLGGGVYYYFFVDSGDESSEASPVSPPSADMTMAPNTPPTPPTSRLSITQPNYLSLDTETATADSIRAELLNKAREVKDGQLAGPVEFLVRDQNYNPLAFSRFSYLAKISLPEALLAQIDEDFSLYVYVDDGRPRIGLSLMVKDPTLFQGELQKAEKGLPQAITPIFFDTTTAPKTGLTFRSGSYNGINTRFANVDSTINLSVDYALRDTRFLIGTSMKTLRAMLDKEMTKKASPGGPQTVETFTAPK